MGDEPGDFKSPLDDTFVEGARYTEPSAREREEWARNARREVSRSKKERKRAERGGLLKKLVPWAVLLAAVGAYWYFISS